MDDALDERAIQLEDFALIKSPDSLSGHWPRRLLVFKLNNKGSAL
jgi:hypothetical protein